MLFCSAFAAAQSPGWKPRDSVRNALDKTPGFRLGLDGRNSFLNGNAVKIAGGRYGLDFGKVAFFTGLYSTSVLKVRDDDTMYSGFNYMSSTFEYYIHQSWRFEVVNSYQIGFGNGFDYRKKGNDVTRSFRGTIIPAELGIGASVRFLRYLSFGAGLGLRVSLNKRAGFSGSYYYYGIGFYTGTMYRDFKKLMKKLK
ncbi:MAG: hypothetical protein IT244_08180 [Bacteroidia bacterium]|nr:hypothetical protein [Bacteroidia bacterium]